MTDHLKPCPFCGGSNIEVREAKDADWQYVAHCMSCGAEGPFVSTEPGRTPHTTARAKAGVEWNTRPVEDAMQPVVDAAVGWANNPAHPGPLSKAVNAYLAAREGRA